MIKIEYLIREESNKKRIQKNILIFPKYYGILKTYFIEKCRRKGNVLWIKKQQVL